MSPTSPLRYIIVLGYSAFSALIASVNADEQPAPLVQKISPHVFQIGKVTFNQETREIFIPANTNITDPDSILEYLLVHFNGEKIHESLLTTEAEPTNINIALKLLDYKESSELFRMRKPDGSLSDKYPDVSEDIKRAARFSIHITWKDGDSEKTIPATQWVYNKTEKKTMPSIPWVYNGSYIYDRKFNAQLTGSIFTIFPNSGAIANYPGDDRDDDTLWTPAPETPEEGTSVKVILKPWRAVP